MSLIIFLFLTSVSSHPNKDVSRKHRVVSSIPSIRLLVFVSFLGIFFAISWQLFLVSFSSSSFPKSLVEYRRYLKEDYYTDPFPLYSSPVFSDHHPKYPINLVLVHRDKNQNSRVSVRQQEHLFKGNVNELFEEEKSMKIEEIGLLDGGRTAAHFVLIEGDPGIGKSTLCWQLCRLWREGKLHHEWDLMVIVELRDEDTRKASNLYELFYHPNDDTRQAIERDIKEREGKGLLIFLDGYDEISEFQREQFSVIHKILTNKLLHNATVVVTTRPTATYNLPPQFMQRLQQYIKIAGFTEADIHSYITSACGEDPQLLEDFRSYVSNNSFILSVMYNPLHCAIVTEIYIDCWKNGQQGFVPSTLTELYKSLVFNLLRHNMPANYSNKETLPEDVKNQLMIIAEFAANGLKSGQYVFTEAPDEMLGLMVPVKKLKKVQEHDSTSYMFLHLTLQEYLAALYWYEHPNQQPTDLMEPTTILSVYGKRRYRNKGSWPVVLFMAGLTKLKSFQFERVMSKDDGDVLILYQLLLEAQFPRLVSEVFSNKTLKLRSEDLEEFTSVDYYALAYCIVNSGNTTTWKLDGFTGYLHRMAYNLHKSIGNTNWDETTGPSIELYLGPNCYGFTCSHLHCYRTCSNLDIFFIHFFPFTKSVTTISFPSTMPIDTLKLVNYSSFPNLKTSSFSAYHEIEPHHEAVLEKIKLPKTLVSIRIHSFLCVLLSNLNQLNELHITILENDK